MLEFAKMLIRCFPLYFGVVCNGEITYSQDSQAQVQILAEPLNSWTNLCHLLNSPKPEFLSLGNEHNSTNFIVSQGHQMFAKAPARWLI